MNKTESLTFRSYILMGNSIGILSEIRGNLTALIEMKKELQGTEKRN